MHGTYAELLAAPAPVTTVVLDARSDQPNAAQQLELRWKNVRRDLGQRGADEPTLAAIDAVIADGSSHPGGDSLVVVAAGGAVLLDRHLPDPPAGDVDLGVVGPVAHLVPLLAADQSAVRHVVVLADRIGADLYARTGPVHRHRADRLSDDGTTERTVEGDPDVQRSAPGGWSQRRFQQRAENTWEANAGEAAAEVVALVDEVRAELLLVGGDERAVGFLVAALPERLHAIVRRLESGSRADGASIEVVATDVHRLVRTAAAERLAGVLATFAEERGQHDRAADGPAAVVSALQLATVETLLVAGDAEGRTAWVGPDPGHLALQRDELSAGMGVAEPVEAALVDACVRAALGTGAAVAVVPATTVQGGLGAILRHTGTAPPVPGRG
jgi:hypothetical protein